MGEACAGARPQAHAQVTYDEWIMLALAMWLLYGYFRHRGEPDEWEEGKW
jgi:hypothetical protein